MPNHPTPPAIRALVLDADEAHSRALAATLALQSIEVTQLASIDLAEKYILDSCPEIVICDSSMIGDEHNRVFKLLKELQARVNEHLVLFSQERSGSYGLPGFEAGSRLVFEKPMKLSQLLEILIEFKARFRAVEAEHSV